MFSQGELVKKILESKSIDEDQKDKLLRILTSLSSEDILELLHIISTKEVGKLQDELKDVIKLLGSGRKKHD